MHYVRSPACDPVTGPPVFGWTKEELIKHVKTAMQVELGTIPIYFCALYSIKPLGDEPGQVEAATSARMHILSVAEQEMLHLALAGNLLRALNDIQTLYDKKTMPTYPSHILYDKIDMKLRPADKENLDCFLKIEAPYMAPPPRPKVAGGEPFIPDYNSIGMFYREVEKGQSCIKELSGDILSCNEEMQFGGNEFFYSEMTIVKDEASALEALSTIVDQGEGSIGVSDSHYAIFVNLYQQRQAWACVDYIDEPHTKKYHEQGNEVAYRLSLAFDASYCYVLQTIDICWQTKDPQKRFRLLAKLRRLMIQILSPCAHVLVKQKLASGKFAAPCFEFYPPEQDDPLEQSKLHERLEDELTSARRQAADQETIDAIEKILFCLKDLRD
ncbi:ferritin-like-domain-containing protein [Vararia minispora EC-137]|uniref:Ferritin-like-domain-containing protein n=1 Tax=Vararia minispora EC-137 TaxID=1314806 RepID=A0ACB8Q676_9AGAM|nr:ferritin-like-domain-containing protein [Vararia minispora EC-137]